MHRCILSPKSVLIQFSDYAVNFISSSRIKTSTIYQTENHQTGTASIFVSEESGENIISIYSGANMDISSDEVKIQKKIKL